MLAPGTCSTRQAQGRESLGSNLLRIRGTSRRIKISRQRVELDGADGDGWRSRPKSQVVFRVVVTLQPPSGLEVPKPSLQKSLACVEPVVPQRDLEYSVHWLSSGAHGFHWVGWFQSVLWPCGPKSGHRDLTRLRPLGNSSTRQSMSLSHIHPTTINMAELELDDILGKAALGGAMD